MRIRLFNEDGQINPILATIGGIVVLLIVVLVVTIVNMFGTRPVSMTVIDNLSDYARTMPRSYQEQIYKRLYNAIGKNLGDAQDIPRKGAIVRENTYEQANYKNSQDILFSEFIVDIAKVQQSYRVSLYWPSSRGTELSESGLNISCVKESERIYMDFNCKEPEPMYSSTEQVRRIDEYLPYIYYGEDGVPQYVVMLYDGWIMVSLQTCGDEKLTAQYRAEVDAWLKNTKIDLEEYKDKTRYRVTCDGDF